MRALVWLRVSTGKQDEASQLPQILAYCEAKGYDVVTPYVQVHGESAFHGAQDPYWTKAVETDADVIVCWKVDRLDRQNLMNSVPMVNRAIASGKRVEFATQEFIDLSTSPGRIAFAMFCEMAHEESKLKSDRVKIKHVALRAEASWASGTAPYGYQIVTAGGRKALEPTEAGRVYVPQIFDRVIAGASLLDVARWLTAQGVLTAKGLTAWNEGTVRQIILNGVYAGRITYIGAAARKAYREAVAKARREGTDVPRAPKAQTYMRCEPLVEADVQRAAQAALTARGKIKGHGTTGRAARSPALIKGMHCGDCGSPMYRVNTGGSKRKDGTAAPRHLYYRCTGSGPQRQGCGLLVALADADAAVTRMLSGNTFPHVIKTVVPGTNWDAEIADTSISIRELDPLDAGYTERQAALVAELTDLRTRKPTEDRVTWTDARNPDGSRQTIGDMFAALDFDGKRAYIASCTVTATRTGIRVVTPEREVPA